MKVNPGLPCFRFISNNPKHSHTATELLAKLCGKTGEDARQVSYGFTMSATFNEFSNSPRAEEIGSDFNCSEFASKGFGIDINIPGNNFCLACPLSSDKKDVLDNEEKEFISYMFRKGPSYAEQVFRTLSDGAFNCYSLLGAETNTFDYPLCVPLARIIYNAVKTDISLFSQISEAVANLCVVDPKTGKVTVKKNNIAYNNDFAGVVFGSIADYCQSADILKFLKKNKGAIWTYICVNFINKAPMSDECAEEFLRERGEVYSQEEFYQPSDNFGVVEEAPVFDEPSLFGGADEDLDTLAAAWEEQSLFEGYPYEEGGSADAPDKPAVSADMERLLREKDEELERLRWDVHHDALTGVYNSRAYKEIGVTKPHDCVLYVDVNNLKYVNDKVGNHQLGDELIKFVASSMNKIFGDVYRVGGDEFVAFPKMSQDELRAAVKGLEKMLEDATEADKSGIVYSVSCGYTYMVDGENIFVGVQRAEGFMKANKKKYKLAHPEYDMRKEKDNQGQDKPAADSGDSAGDNHDGEEGEGEAPESKEKTEEEIFTPAGELTAHPYFTKKVEVTEGGYLSSGDNVRRIPMRNRRYLIPFAENDYSSAENRNVIIHHEITSRDISAYDEKGNRASKVFELITNSENEDIETELDHLQGVSRNKRMCACEVAYVTDKEMYVLLMWNASSGRMDYFVLITKKEGIMRPMPRQVIEILKSEGIKKVCYQPYLLYSIMGLYVREVEIKNVHSIYSEYFVFNEQSGKMNHTFEEVMDSYVISPSEKLNKTLSYMDRMFNGCPLFMRLMGIYSDVARMQLDYSKAFGYDARCASRHRKDLMYGYSYLAAGVYPSMQKAMFKLTPSGQFIFFNKPDPSISYFEGYMVQYMFSNINADPGDKGEKKKANEKSNVRARQLLLKDLATVGKGFYHTNIKILYLDEYYMIFYMAHNYLVQNQQFIETALKRECTLHKIKTDQFLYSCWATTFDTVRLVNKH